MSAAQKIEIPKVFKDILEREPFLSSPAESLLAIIKDPLNRSNRLFPEYTDHGSDHVQCVLNDSFNLIPEQTIKSISTEDVYVITVACCLHDYAMSFDWADLQDLINDSIYSQILPGFSKEPSFQSLWEKYEQQYNSADREFKYGLIGEEFKDDIDTLNFPDISQSDTTISPPQFKIAGEFVRRHHARISQSISLHKIPNLGYSFTEGTNYPKIIELNRLSGLVARSHHISLRDMCSGVLRDTEKDLRFGAHTIYLMCLLRISDIMQITQTRTPAVLFNLRKFWSKKSDLEWKKHLTLIQCSIRKSSPVSIHFELSSTVTSVEVLSEVRELLALVQKELDLATITVSDIYNQSNEMTEFRLIPRRVTSDFDDNNLIERLSFHQHPARITSDNRIPALLIKPLYGNTPSIALRELLQNSLDAVREAVHLKRKSDEDISTYEVNINVYQEGTSYFVEVSDQGIGMSCSKIIDHFTRIGSSFRETEAWKNSYKVGSNNEVIRSGRFGIGMLAAFIITDRMDIETKSQEDPNGWSFTINLKNMADSRIQLNKTHRNTGTSINLEIEKSTYQQLATSPHTWNWYFSDKPEKEVKIACLVNGSPTSPPLPITNSDYTWLVIADTDAGGCTDVKWSLDMTVNNGANIIYINCLRIGENATAQANFSNTLDSFDQHEKTWSYDIHYPFICVNDPNTAIGLTLKRDGLMSNLPFGEKLYKDVTHEIIKRISNSALEITESSTTSDISKLHLATSNLLRRTEYCSQQLFNGEIGFFGRTKGGYVFSDINDLKRKNIKKIFVLGPGCVFDTFIPYIDENTAAFKINSLGHFQSHDRYNKAGKIEQSWVANLYTYFLHGSVTKHMFNTDSGQCGGMIIPSNVYATMNHLLPTGVLSDSTSAITTISHTPLNTPIYSNIPEIKHGFYLLLDVSNLNDINESYFMEKWSTHKFDFPTTTSSSTTPPRIH